jgi:threonine dehydrogenase-like Zn-dependent dehydrogenase
MRAAVMTEWTLRIDEVPDPVAGSGQVLTRVLACGICGSDLHMVQHGAEMRAMAAQFEADAGVPPGFVDPSRPSMFEPHLDTVMGHEFCCEVVELGPGVSTLSVGDVVVSMPVAFDARGVHPLGYSNRYPGGYAELMVINEMLALPVPAGLSARIAAMTEPLAVGVHAVAKSGILPGEAAVVLGLGPVGLACVAELKRLGIGPVVGADFSPKRRELAEHLGCDVVVDPALEPAIVAWRALDTSAPLVVFEAVGVPGMIDAAMRMAPRDARIVVVGACMQQDRIHPMVGIGRELSIQFVLGYTPEEFASALRSIAEGAVDLEPMLTGSVGIDGVIDAFGDLGNPDHHAKILVEP